MKKVNIPITGLLVLAGMVAAPSIGSGQIAHSDVTSTIAAINRGAVEDEVTVLLSVRRIAQANIPAVKSRQLGEALMTAVREHPSEGMRFAAATALPYWLEGKPQVIAGLVVPDALAELAESLPEGGSRTRVVAHLRLVPPSPAAIAALVRFAQAEDEMAGVQAVETLAHMGQPGRRALERLVELGSTKGRISTALEMLRRNGFRSRGGG